MCSFQCNRRKFLYKKTCIEGLWSSVNCQRPGEKMREILTKSEMLKICLCVCVFFTLNRDRLEFTELICLTIVVVESGQLARVVRWQSHDWPHDIAEEPRRGGHSGPESVRRKTAGGRWTGRDCRKGETWLDSRPGGTYPTR